MLPRPSHPVPNVRDDRETPLCVGRDGGSSKVDLGLRGSAIFLQAGLDSRNRFARRASRLMRKNARRLSRYVPRLTSEAIGTTG
jgi:hypothetical protein